MTPLPFTGGEEPRSGEGMGKKHLTKPTPGPSRKREGRIS
jgi:hypothetical protein